MRRAANQSGSIVPPISIRQSVTMTDREEIGAEHHIERHVETEVRSVSNGSVQMSHDVQQQFIRTEAPMEPARKVTEKEYDSLYSSPSKESVAPSIAIQAPQNAPQNSMQQLQIVRLLTDLGDKLRQSEKEREVLWKEVDSCRKQIAEMGGRGDKTEKAYMLLENQITQREDFIESLLAKHESLEEKLAAQTKELENAREEQGRLGAKVNSIETATGSAIVRVEDAVAENTKLAKRVEALGQDKARLLHKLETMEDTLTQTQESLRAKAIVLLTDNALASRTNLPQTPAWTGNDTLKFSRPQEAPADTTTVRNPAADVAASLSKKPSPFRLNTILFIAIVLCGVIGGVFFSKMNVAKLLPLPAAQEQKDVSENSAVKVTEAAPQDQELVMSRLATLANQIEPGGLTSEDDKDVPPDNMTDDTLSNAASMAHAAEEKAIAAYKLEILGGTASQRVISDKALPKDIKDIEAKAIEGDPESQHDMAVIYSSGQNGVQVNYNKAIKWFDEAAHQGVANAQYNLGVLFHHGLGINKDLARAILLYRVAAAAGHPEAQYNLAIAYIDGIGTESNPQVATYYFEQAAEGGVIEAAYNLGLLHENGLLGESQPDEALFWYALAAEKGNPDAKKSMDMLKAQLSMTDEDVTKLMGRIAKQKNGFINDSGVVTLPEAKMIRTKDNVAEVSAPAPVTAPISKTTIKAPVISAVNDQQSSALISQIEEQLGRLGLYAGLPDGKSSDKLVAAIKTYQKNNALTVDGNVNEDMLVRLLATDAP